MDDFPDYPCRHCIAQGCRSTGWQGCLKFRVWFGRWWDLVRRNAAEWRAQPAGDVENEEVGKQSGEINDAQRAE